MTMNRIGRAIVLLAGVVSGFGPAPASAEYVFVTQFGTFGGGVGQFNDPRGVASRGSQIVISESGNDRIQLCSESGSCSAFGSFGVLDGQFDRPRGVAVDGAGQIVIADRGNDRIQICSTTGNCDDLGGSGTGLGQFESPRGVTVNSLGQIVVADTENHRIQICSPQGACTSFGRLGGSLGQFDTPVGVAMNSQGRIVVSDRFNERIQICTTQGSCTAFGTPGSGPGQFNEPTGIAVDSQDRIIVVDRANHRVQVCTQQGSCSTFGGFGQAPGRFNAPWGVAVDSQDRIIVADLGNNRIQIFAEQADVSIDSFSASPTALQTGQAVTLAWTVSNAQSCTPLGGTAGWSQLSINPAGGSVQLVLNAPGTFTFTLQCSGGGQSDSSSVTVTVSASSSIEINAGLNDAWFNPDTPGQGFFLTVFPDIQMIFLAWFTYDTTRPPGNVTAVVGEPGHRWLTAFGPFSGSSAVLDIEVTSGGVFNAASPMPVQAVDGSIMVEFSGCNSALVSYDIISANLQGSVPIQRIALDNVPGCEALQ